jgi:zinc transporter ZupT
MAMLLGGLLGFVIGAVAGLGSSALDAPVLMPFLGAAAGVLLGAVVTSILGFSGARERGREQATRRELAHRRLRHESHQGWIEGIDLTAETPPRRREQ